MLIVFQVCVFVGISVTVISVFLGNLFETVGMYDNLPVAVFLIIMIALLVGLLFSVLVYQLVVKPIKSARNTSLPDAEELVGLRATVSETIYFGESGEIRYVINGNSFTSSAKATNGVEIKSGKDVVICWIEEHILYVSSLDDVHGKPRID